MKKQLLTAVGALLCAPGGFAQTPQALPLYPDGAVESNGFSAADVRLTATNLDKCAEADYFVFPADPAQATGQSSSVPEEGISRWLTVTRDSTWPNG